MTYRGTYPIWIDRDIGWVDLDFLGIPHAIGTGVITSQSGVALVDPGPSTCIEALECGLGTLGFALEDVSDILLTHIHLDHAGATGTLVSRHPRICVHVHERGVKHLVDPAKLINSAARYFGEEKMARYWGEILPVPADRLSALGTEGTIRVGTRTLKGVYTPGHAIHHLAYLDLASTLMFVGDAAGIRINRGYILPPTPPPDIDVEDWLTTLDRMAALQPRNIVLTHGGAVDDVEAHLAATRANLLAMAEYVRSARMTDPATGQAVGEFGSHIRALIAARNDPADLPAYEPTAPVGTYWHGLERYWSAREPIGQRSAG